MLGTGATWPIYMKHVPLFCCWSVYWQLTAGLQLFIEGAEFGHPSNYKHHSRHHGLFTNISVNMLWMSNHIRRYMSDLIMHPRLKLSRVVMYTTIYKTQRISDCQVIMLSTVMTLSKLYLKQHWFSVMWFVFDRESTVWLKLHAKKVDHTSDIQHMLHDSLQLNAFVIHNCWEVKYVCYPQHTYIRNIFLCAGNTWIARMNRWCIGII